MVADVIVEVLPDEILHEALKHVSGGVITLDNHAGGWHVAGDGHVQAAASPFDMKGDAVTNSGEREINVRHQVVIEQNAA